MSTLMCRVVRGVLSSMVGVAATLCAGAANAVPIQYILSVDGGNTSGTLGGVAFTQGLLTLVFTGDTDGVVPYTVSNAPDPGTTSGYILLNGTTSLFIFDLANNAQYSATFLPGAGIFVSTDNTHFSVGFGSFGVAPGQPGFPGLPVYPEGLLGGCTTAPGCPWGTYDLRSPLPSSQGWTISDAGFPGPVVPVGPPLPTTQGALILNHQSIAFSYFEAQIVSFPFASLHASAHASKSRGHFAVVGHVTFEGASNGFNPQTDPLSFTFGPFSATVPAGSLQTGEDGQLYFRGDLAGAEVNVTLHPNRSGTGYRFAVSVSEVNLTTLGSLASFTLTLGDNTGSASLAVHSFDDD